MATTATRVVKRVGKENNAPKIVHDMDDTFDDFETDDAPVKPKSMKSRPAVKANQEEESAAGSSSMAKKLAAVTAERDRARAQRDTFAKQFEELSKTRSTDMEALFEKYKKTAALQSQAQSDIIDNLTKLNETLQTRASGLEKDVVAANAATERATKLLPYDAKLEKQDAKTLRDEVLKLRAALKSKDAELEQVQKEYAAEVKHSRELQKSQKGPSAPVAASVPSAESDKDAASLMLYEDLTGLNILSVELKTTPNTGKERIYTCCQTVDGRSLAFKLRLFNLFNAAKKRWDKSVEYTPDKKALGDERDTDLLRRLGPFSDSFVAPRDQITDLWEAMQSRISRTREYDAVPEQ